MHKLNVVQIQMKYKEVEICCRYWSAGNTGTRKESKL